ncbi:hypothetical protein BZG36_00151 [Bifiguratus adelaidae]|uniref:Ubiquitin carboxyl-terminal hydrolase n=1 Tax=Bifiguratus adelaidae TaxID=1938954 RepID=A0A261Y8M0_9FUNG|nr:hypothetical protein BZG36_00151 [Bifiguratus adelaidae]
MANDVPVEKAGLRWLPLEANPEVMNEFMYNLGMSKEYAFTDVYGFDPTLLAMVPQPVLAIILCFPVTPAYEKYRLNEEAHITQFEQNVCPDIIFYKQTISNACGTIALLQAVSNNEIVIKTGTPLATLVEKAQPMSADERAELLESDTTLAQAHQASASTGQTAAPDINADVNLHFVCFIVKENHLYELDGRKPFPINHGKCTDLLSGGVKLVQQFMARDPDNVQFNLIALTKAE